MRPPPRRGTGSRLGHPEEALAFTAPAGFVRPRDSRASQTPWSVFQDGSGGSPTSSPQTRGTPRRAVPSDGGGRRARSPSPRLSRPPPSARRPVRGAEHPSAPGAGPDPGEAITADEPTRGTPAHLPRRAHGRPGAGRGARPAESAPGGRARGRRGGREIRTRKPPPPRPG